MPISNLFKFHDFPQQVGKGTYDFSLHVFKIALTNVAPVQATYDTLSDISEIAESGGYTAGGYTLPGTSWTNVAGTSTFYIPDFTITATGGSIGPFRYIVLYNNTQTTPNKPLIGFYDYGASITLYETEPLLVNFNDVAGAFQLS
jgi:hypothetical protein